MDITGPVVLAGGFVGGLVSGMTGFGTGLSAMPFWLMVVSPVTAAQLAAAGAIVTHVTTISKVRASVSWSHVGPFVLAGVAGIPLGLAIVPHIEPQTFAVGVGLVISLFSLIVLFGRGRKLISGRNRKADLVVGFFSGIATGLAGMSGVLPSAWAVLHDWTRDEKRALFQVFNLFVLAVMLALSAIVGLLTWDFIYIFAWALPGSLIGSQIGSWIYLKLDTRGFDRVIITLLFVSGVALLITNL